MARRSRSPRTSTTACGARRARPRSPRSCASRAASSEALDLLEPRRARVRVVRRGDRRRPRAASRRHGLRAARRLRQGARELREEPRDSRTDRRQGGHGEPAVEPRRRRRVPRRLRALANDFHERALALRESVGDRWAIGVSMNNLGMIAVLQKRYDEARDWFEKSMALNREVGDAWMVAICHNNLGNATRGLGDYSAARKHYADSLRAYRDYDDRWALAFLLEDIGVLAALDGDASAALELIGAADAIREAIGAPRAPSLEQEMERATLAACWGIVAGGARSFPCTRTGAGARCRGCARLGDLLEGLRPLSTRFTDACSTIAQRIESTDTDRFLLRLRFRCGFRATYAVSLEPPGAGRQKMGIGRMARACVAMLAALWLASPVYATPITIIVDTIASLRGQHRAISRSISLPRRRTPSRSRTSRATARLMTRPSRSPAMFPGMLSSPILRVLQSSSVARPASTNTCNRSSLGDSLAFTFDTTTDQIDPTSISRTRFASLSSSSCRECRSIPVVPAAPFSRSTSA